MQLAIHTHKKVQNRNLLYQKGLWLLKIAYPKYECIALYDEPTQVICCDEATNRNVFSLFLQLLLPVHLSLFSSRLDSPQSQ